MTADFTQALTEHGLGPLRRAAPTWLQVNLGRRCNQACTHCHVDASPARTEVMDGATVDEVLRVLRANPGLEKVDLTGGAPELNPHFRRLVRASVALGRQVMDRCNLTILSEPGQEDLADFLAAQGVHVVASLPCYTEDNVDRQRGKQVFARSIAGLKQLNALGYGRPGSGLMLDLVYNPGGDFLPPSQAGLQSDYTARLAQEHGVVFNELLTLANMPIARFARELRRKGRLEAYMELLVRSFNPATVEGLMCRHLISVDWRGRVYDCDFNQMLGIDVPGPIRTISQVDRLADWEDRAVAVGPHCFGCTAGAGSSCGGALAG